MDAYKYLNPIFLSSSSQSPAKMVEINLGIQDFTTVKFWRAVVAEFFGMVIFLLSVSLVCQPWSKTGVDSSANHIEIGLGIGLSITTAAVMVGHVSGGHLNPAVTLGCIFTNRISVIQGLFYIPAQMVGGMCYTGFLLGAIY